ncbi:hypothetical protein I317_03082 [Kwoniella heveanensis CBS 569]|nr:hypothetical protein I317_03082 [Kwoniella heveanensis CBS 569]
METPTPTSVTAATASTSNYYEVAQKDDQAAIERGEQEHKGQTSSSASASSALPSVSAIGSGTPTATMTHGGNRAGGGKEEGVAVSKDDKAEIRRQRIAAAVERSRSEYKAEHAFTERWWYEDESIDRNVLSKPKADRQHLEYLTTGLYYSKPPEYKAALDLILKAYDSAPSTGPKRPLGGLTRELIDIGIRAALALGDWGAAVRLVEGSKSLWKGQNAGHSALSAEVYLKSGRSKDALTPLLMSLSSFGLHAPILNLLSQALNELVQTTSASPEPSSTFTASPTLTATPTSTATLTFTATRELIAIVDRAAAWKGSFLQTRLFESESREDVDEVDDDISIPISNAFTTSTTADITDQNTADPTPQSQSQIPQTQAVDMTITDPINIPHITLELGLDADQKKYLEGTWARLSKGLKGDEGVVERSVREL